MEALNDEDAGYPIDALEALVDEALAEIERHTAADVFIIEDEPIMAMDMETIVHAVGYSVIGVATRSIWLRRSALGRCLRISSFPTTVRVSTRSRRIGPSLRPVIFIRAFPERLLTVKRPEPTFMITEPVRNSMVEAVVSQALFFEAATVPAV